MSSITSVNAAASARPIEVEGKRQSQSETGAFGTLLDAVNPLQHVPGVAQGYRALTGDKTSDGASLAGKVAIGAAVAGPIGMAAGAGLFVAEKLLPGLFKGIGRLFGGGHSEGVPVGQAKMPRIAMPEGSATIDAIAERAAPKAPATVTGAPRVVANMPGKVPAPEMSSAQFTTLLESFGMAAPVTTDSAKKPANDDVAARMKANLDKYSAMKRAGE
jgi:hypothetical protein